MKILKLLTILYFFIAQLSAQNKSQLTAPLMQEVEIGEAVIFKVDWNEQYQLSWTSNLDSAKFDRQEGEFYWDNPKGVNGLFQVEFALTDSAKKLVEKATTVIKVMKRAYTPLINFSPDSLINDGFIVLGQGESYGLEFVATSANVRRNENVLISYVLNGNPNIKSFEQSEITILGNRLLLQWKPTQQQADNKYYDLEIIAIDETNSISRSDFHFKIQDKNLPPSFKYSLSENYIISADQPLTIDFSVNDPDNEEYNYLADLSVQGGAVLTTKDGQFSWKLSSNELAALSDNFPVELTLKAVNKNNSEELIAKKVQITQNRNNTPPTIARLSNLSIREGYAVKRRVFVNDENHSLNQLEFKLENEPQWLYLQQDGEALFLMSDTLGFDIVKADGIPVQYDVLLSVRDPEMASDNKFFTITVNEGINSQKIYQQYTNYLQNTETILSGLRLRIEELDDRLEHNAKLKKAFLLSSIFLGGFSAVGSFFDEQTIANQAVPYTGAALAISSSVNALAFNQEGQITTLKVKLEAVEKNLIRNRSYLLIYDVLDENDEQLKNPELVDKVKSYRQQLIEQHIELEKLEDNYRELNYIKKQIKRNRRKGREGELAWDFLNQNQ